MENELNYYQILHVQPDAPLEIIRSSYRTMMQRMRMHPDLGGDDINAAHINEAYAILTNPRNRAAYDRARLTSERPGAAGKTAAVLIHCRSQAGQLCAFCGTPHESGEKVPADALCNLCQSPLAPAVRPQMEGRSRRKILRVPYGDPLNFYTHWPQGEAFTCRTDNVSLVGMKFYSNIDLEIGQVIKIDSRILKSVAQVCHHHREGEILGVGVQFLRLRFEQSRGCFISVRA